MWKMVLLMVVGLSGGFIVAGGVIALMVGLGIITRFAGITHAAKHVKIYETGILLGAVCGNILSVYETGVPFGTAGLAVTGIFFGIFVGAWILALAEIVNIFPIFTRRAGIIKGYSWMILAIAIGKSVGSMLHFYMRWGL